MVAQRRQVRRTPTKLALRLAPTSFYDRTTLLAPQAPMSLTDHVVVLFGLDGAGHPVPLSPIEAPNADSARRRAQRLSETNAGAVAFNRTGNPASGEFADANIIAVFGTVDISLLAE